MKKGLFLLFLLFVSVFVNAQYNIDSLLQIYGTSSAEQRQKSSNAFLIEMPGMTSDRVKEYAGKWMEKSKEFGDRVAKVTALQGYGHYHYIRGEFNQAEPYFKENLDLHKQLNNKLGLAQAYNLLGNLAHAQASFQTSVEYHLNALRLREELKNDKAIGASYNNLANAYRGLSQFDKSLEYHKLSLAIKEKLKDTRGISMAFVNIANTYWQLNDTHNVYLHYKKALELQTQLKDERMIATTNNSLGFISKELGKYDEAMHYLQKSLQYRIKAEDKDALATTYLNIGAVYHKTKDYKNAKLYLNKALQIANTIRDKGVIMDVNKLLGYIAEEEKDYEKSIALLKDADKMKDSIFKVEGLRTVAEMQTKYETEKKEASIRLLEKENELKDIRNRQQLYIAISIVLLLVIGGAGYYAFMKAQQQKRRATEQLAVEKARLSTVIQTQEDERKRISAELHDGIGPVLSTVKMNLSMVIPNAENAGRYDIAMKLIDKSYKELRQISHTMMPAMLAKTGLAQTIQELANNLSLPGKLQFKCYVDEEALRYSEQVEINVYRIIQELLNNIVKYANAREVNIHLYQEANELSLMIEDDGDGYDVNMLNRSKGNGWVNIQSRLSLLNGTIEIDSKNGRKGSTIHIIVPAPEVVRMLS